jgi:DNA-binding NtrC family response regulator
MGQRAVKGRVLLVDDERDMCVLLEEGLSRKGFDVDWQTSSELALATFGTHEFDAVLTDVQLGGDNGLDLCGRMVASRPDVPVVVISGFGNMEMAVGALRAGAYDFVEKPIDMESLVLTLDRAVRHRQLKRELCRLEDAAGGVVLPHGIVGTSATMRRLSQHLDRFASSDAAVLICGESGTGKELVARAIHTSSRRADGPFVAVNCAAVPATLLESTLFGHVKGAFTDARSHNKGLFLEADGGTMLLDEIGDMPFEMQSKLLRALQERVVRPVGGNTEIAFDARILSATNRDLDKEVAEGRFREDLYYRLNVVTVEVPPLRDRRVDILPLAQHFVETIAARTHRGVVGLTPEAGRVLMDYQWPGNVRQLENAIERAVALARYDRITLEDLPERIVHPSPESTYPVAPEQLSTADEVERFHVERVLLATGGNKAVAARVLGFDRRTLYRKLARWKMRSPS